MTGITRLLTTAAVALGAVVPVHGQSPVAVGGVAVDTRAGATVIAIKTSGPVRYRAARLDAPPRLVLDLDEATSVWRDSPLRVDRGPVREIRTPPQAGAGVKVVIELAHASDYLVERARDGLRVVLAPAEDPVDRASAAAPSPGAAAPDPVLLGVVRSGRGWAAYLEESGTSHVAGYRVGDTVADRAVEMIDADRVVLTGPRGRLELRLENESAGTIERRR